MPSSKQSLLKRNVVLFFLVAAFFVQSASAVVVVNATTNSLWVGDSATSLHGVFIPPNSKLEFSCDSYKNPGYSFDKSFLLNFYALSSAVLNDTNIVCFSSQVVTLPIATTPIVTVSSPDYSTALGYLEFCAAVWFGMKLWDVWRK
jgi:hypothetical protein